MDIFEGRYFSINRKLLMLIGQWPYETTTKTVIRPVFMAMQLIFSMPHLISAIVHYEDIDRLMLSLFAYFNAMAGFIKVAGLTAAESHLKNVYESIAKNWLSISEEKEREILVEYSQRSRNITIFYSVSVTIACTMLSLLPAIPKILDKIIPLAQPRPSIYLLEGEFFVDRETHFIELFCCDVILVLLCLLTTIAAETIYVALTHHCCALYAIIRYRSINLMQTVVNKSLVIEGHLHDRLVQTIQLHKKALEFTSTINDSYSTIFLFILIVNLGLIPLVACAIVAHLQEPLRLVPYLAALSILVSHLFILTWPGQRILDHGISLGDAAYCNEWYTAPIRVKKLLLIYMLRCTQPVSLSAGGLLLMNFETLAMIMRTAVSYFTALASFR